MNERSIGGFFELELPQEGTSFHNEALALHTGRACIRFILEKEKPSKVYVPFYVCDAVYEPMDKLGIPYECYPITNSLDPVELPTLESNELLLYINYFGLKNREASEFSHVYGKQLIIDDTHRFFFNGYPDSYSFTSARKYFGVPDGAYLYGAENVEAKSIPRFDRISVDHAVYRLVGRQAEAYENYKAYEASLDSDINRISILSERLLNSVNYPEVQRKRNENFQLIHSMLGRLNTLRFEGIQIDGPYCYPYLPEQTVNKDLLHQNAFFVPCLWPDILNRDCNSFAVERDITERLLPLPIDHRYGENEMQRLADFIISNS